jgi:hypothetical protein
MKIVKIAISFNENLFHGTSIELKKLILPKESALRGIGIFLSDSFEYAKVFGNYIYLCNVKLKNPKVYEDSIDFEVDCLKNKGVNQLYAILKENNFDGVIILRSKVSTGRIKEVICFYENSVQIINKV